MSLFDGLMAQVHRKVGKKYIDIFAGFDPLVDTVRDKCKAEIMYDRLIIAARGIRRLLQASLKRLSTAVLASGLSGSSAGKNHAGSVPSSLQM